MPSTQGRRGSAARCALIACERLDPRSEAAAAADPIPDSVNIPYDQLPGRWHELPPRDVPVRVVGPVPLAERTVALLHGHARAACIETGPPDDTPSDAIRRLWRPNALLEQVVPGLRPGRAIDLACGCGRDAVFLAALGWQVTAVDILPDALERGRQLQLRYAPAAAPICWIEADLERELPVLEPAELVTVFRFLDRPLYRRLAELVRPGGTVLVETFTTLHRARHGRPSRDAFVLRPGELPGLLCGLQIVEYGEAWRGGSHTARVCAVRPARG